MRIIIVDDHPLVQEALHQVLRALVPSAEVLKTQTLAGLRQLLSTSGVPTDLLLLDVTLEAGNTLDWLGSAPPELLSPRRVPVLLFTGGDNATLARANAMTSEIASTQGYAGVVHKGAPGQVLQAAITQALGLKKVAHQALTPRHHALMRLVCVGATNLQIAGQLGVSQSTVKAHLSQIFDRLQVHNRGQAALQYAALYPLADAPAGATHA